MTADDCTTTMEVGTPLQNETVAPGPAVDVHWATDLLLCGKMAFRVNLLPFRNVSARVHAHGSVRRRTEDSSRCTVSAPPSCWPGWCCGQRYKPRDTQMLAPTRLTGSLWCSGTTTTTAAGGSSSGLLSRHTQGKWDPRPESSLRCPAGRRIYRTPLTTARAWAPGRRRPACQTRSPTLDRWRRWSPTW